MSGQIDLVTGVPIETTMTLVLTTMLAILVGMHSIQLPSQNTISKTNTLKKYNCLTLFSSPFQLPNPKIEPTKYCYELFCWYYTVIWVGIFGFIVVSQSYEHFTAWGYLGVCAGLALPLVLQPMIYPQAWSPKGHNRMVLNPDTCRRFTQRYSTKATLYLLTYSFIGNYWYTHYFYSVLKAKYTMPSHRFNGIPIAMFFATHFYFSTYHVSVSNGFLRFVDRQYQDGWRKKLLFWYTVLFLSYLTAFMETLSISSFPYYSFENRTIAYVWGSAFYGIYFLVSFPGFYFFDAEVDEELQSSKTDTRPKQTRSRQVTLWDTFTIACGHGRMILTLLDFVRLFLGIPLVIEGVAFALT